MVLYLGGSVPRRAPDYFIEAAAQVLQALPEVRFVMAGAGDMMGQMIELVGSRDRRPLSFHGFSPGEEIERIFSLSDLYVMPSVSEPFGISPLEAMLYDVPVIISASRELPRSTRPEGRLLGRQRYRGQDHRCPEVPRPRRK